MKPPRTHLCLLAGFALTMVFTLTASAQKPEPSKPATEPKPAEPGTGRLSSSPYGPTITRIFPLKNITQMQDLNEVIVALRTVSDPRDQMTMLPAQNAIIIEAPADHIAAAEKIVNDLDKPKKAYRLTYTLIDLDGTKRLGDQHYTMVLVPSQRSVLKQVNKVPVATGYYLKETNSTQTQFTYLDVGMSFEATLDDSTNSLRLKTKVDQSSVVEDHPGSTLAQDPIVRVSSFEGSAILTPGKPLTIGTLDIAGTTRRIEIQATVDPINP